MTEHMYMRAVIERSDDERASDGGGAPGEPIRFVAATEGVKRDGLDLDMNGARLDNYLANPAFLWSHDYIGTRPPIGKTVNLQVFDGRLVADVVFDQADEFARAIEAKYRGGYLNTVSIGWDPKQNEGQRIVDWELLDISAVNIPGDPNALMERQTVALRSLHERLGDALDMIMEPEPEPEPEKQPIVDHDDKFTRDLANLVSDRVVPQIVEATTTILDQRLGEVEQEPVIAPDVQTDEEPVSEAVRDIISEIVDQRIGSVLSKRNREKLESAKTNIEQVLDAAKPPEKDESEPEKYDGDDGGDRGAHDRGYRLAAYINARIDEMADEEMTRGDIIEMLADEAEISVDTMNQILDGSINCPPEERLKAFARVLGVSPDALINSARGDGCEYDDRGGTSSARSEQDQPDDSFLLELADLFEQ